MSNTVNLEFAGDASKLAKAAKQAQQATEGVGKSATAANDDFKRAADGGADLTTRMGRLGAATSGATDAIDSATGTMQALVDVQQFAKEKASRLGRALNDVEQAQNDLNQAQADGRQATLDVGQAQIDAKQAALDAAEATREYDKAVKEHGKGSAEAQQALIDLKQAQQDGKQANEDLKQAQLDANQAVTDGKSAQLDLNDAQRESHPPELQGWADKLNLLSPLLTGLVGVVSLVTAAQWAWNAAQLASPTTWIVLGILLLVGVIVLIATKTDWFQRAWKAAWGGIKKAASATWDFLKKIPGWIGDAFSKVSDAVSRPFKAAFNAISRAWNNTIGKLSWTVPAWIPGVGGNTISAPQLPQFHTGGVVPGTPGHPVPILAMAGETVTPAGRSGGAVVLEVHSGGSRLDDLLVELLSRAVRVRGGNVQLVLGGGRG